MGWISFLWADQARREVSYLEDRVRALENRIVTLENEVKSLKTK